MIGDGGPSLDAPIAAAAAAATDLDTATPSAAELAVLQPDGGIATNGVDQQPPVPSAGIGGPGVSSDGPASLLVQFVETSLVDVENGVRSSAADHIATAVAQYGTPGPRGRWRPASPSSSSPDIADDAPGDAPAATPPPLALDDAGDDEGTVGHFRRLLFGASAVAPVVANIIEAKHSHSSGAAGMAVTFDVPVRQGGTFTVDADLQTATSSFPGWERVIIVDGMETDDDGPFSEDVTLAELKAWVVYELARGKKKHSRFRTFADGYSAGQAQAAQASAMHVRMESGNESGPQYAVTRADRRYVTEQTQRPAPYNHTPASLAPWPQLGTPGTVPLKAPPASPMPPPHP